ncbi:hypothetical protein C8Q72DRAFT_836083 [Fomitopsis betulina]|nr:hypothetical protein C8Q72DRAFT_836083 [Fomitopsis betulina]
MLRLGTILSAHLPSCAPTWSLVVVPVAKTGGNSAVPHPSRLLILYDQLAAASVSRNPISPRVHRPVSLLIRRNASNRLCCNRLCSSLQRRGLHHTTRRRRPVREDRTLRASSLREGHKWYLRCSGQADCRRVRHIISKGSHRLLSSHRTTASWPTSSLLCRNGSLHVVLVRSGIPSRS